MQARIDDGRGEHGQADGNSLVLGAVCRAAAAGASMAPALARFAPISLEEMQDVALLDRVEVKYVMESTALLQSLPLLQASYRVLEVEGCRLSRYRTLYFDTQDFALYHRHHAGARVRYKVRAREYVESQIAFFEVKQKLNKRRTVKHRVPTAELLTRPEESTAQFLSTVCPYDAQELLPRLWNRYSRITLVARDTQERVTLDVGLAFNWRQQQADLPGIVIAEVKQPGIDRQSPFMQIMRERRIRRSGFSKYCVGVSLIYPEIRHNNFMPARRHVARLMQGNVYVTH